LVLTFVFNSPGSLLPKVLKIIVIIIIATKKSAKYADLTAAYVFQPIAVENLSPINASALDFISNLGQKISYLSATT